MPKESLLPYYQDPNSLSDSTDAVPDISLELQRTAEDIINGYPPSTVLGTLYQENSIGNLPTENLLAALIGSPQLTQVKWALETFEEEGHVLKVKENGIEKYVLPAHLKSMNSKRLASLVMLSEIEP